MHYLSKEQHRNLILKEGLKYDWDVYIVSYSLEDELCVIKSLSRYTHNFITLTTNNYHNILFHNCKKYNINKYNCNLIFNNIFNNEKSDPTNIKVDEKHNTSYLIFMRTRNNHNYDMTANARKFQFKYMVTNLRDFFLCDYIYYNGWGILHFSDQQHSKPCRYRIVYNDIVMSNDSIVVSPLPGLGDYMMFFSMLYEFFQNKLKEGKKVYIVTYQDRPSEIELLSCLFPDINILLFDNEYVFDYCMSKTDTEGLLSMLFIHINNSRIKAMQTGCHVTQNYASMLELDKSFNPYKNSDIFKERILKFISKEEKLYIDNTVSYKKYIGIQFFTGIYDDKYDVWITDSARVWKEKNVIDFIELCSKADINLLTVGYYPYEKLMCNRLEKLSTVAYIYAISKLNMVVGIDSSAGHIAALYGIPNITIWGRQTPFELVGNKCSFRTLTKNISIYAKTGCIDDISPQYLYDTVKAVLDRKIKVEDKILSYFDTNKIYRIE